MDRKDVYKLIDEERDYQDNLDDSRTDGRIHSVAEELVLMNVYLQKSFLAWTNNPGDKFALKQITKVIALGVRCLENNYE